MCRTRRSSTLGHADTPEAEDGEEGVAVTVHVSAGEGLANINPTPINQDQLTKEPQRVIMHKAHSASP